MPEYKIYLRGPDGHISGPPESFECAEEQEALRKLAMAVNGNAPELWSGNRLVARFPSDETK
jgi:hypothetical protein